VQRYYRLKARILNVDQLYDYDRYAPLFADQPSCDWKQARQIVQESTALSAQGRGDRPRVLRQRWIDAELRTGKRSGAFSSSAVPSAHP